MTGDSTAVITTLALTATSLIPFYLLGAFPTGHLIARARGITIEEHGSGNVGATNVLRTIGKKAGAMTFAGDFLKGALAAALGSALGGEVYGGYAGAAAVLGHCFSIPGRLKGGKGVATAFGVFSVCTPWAAVGAFLGFLATLKVGKMVSLASIVSALLAPLLAMLFGTSDSALPALAAIGLLVVWRHRPNIQRIIEGREPQIGQGGVPSKSNRSPPH